MGSVLPILGLYQPGGGSSGLITPDEVADIDRLNENFKKIDDWAGVTNAFRVAQVSRNQQFVGLAADKGSVAGMKRGDTYQETDGTYPQFFGHDGTAWKNRTRARAQLLSATAAVNGTAFLDLSTASASLVYQEGGKFWEAAPTGVNTDLLIPYSGKYRVYYAYRLGGGVAPITLEVFKNGATVGADAQASAISSAGASTHTQRQLDIDLASADKLSFRITSNAANAGRGQITIDYLGEV